LADKLKFELVSPEKLLLSSDVDMVVVPGAAGDLGVLPGHAPLITTVRPGVIEVHQEGAQVQRLFVRGGFAEVTPQGLTVLADEAMPLADLDRAALAQRLKDAEEDVRDARDETTRHRAEQAADQLRQVVDALALI
jgi:F-type H+-transporting ATPase subunit epsilon